MLSFSSNKYLKLSVSCFIALDGFAGVEVSSTDDEYDCDDVIAVVLLLSDAVSGLEVLDDLGRLVPTIYNVIMAMRMIETLLP